MSRMFFKGVVLELSLLKDEIQVIFIFPVTRSFLSTVIVVTYLLDLYAEPVNWQLTSADLKSQCL